MSTTTTPYGQQRPGWAFPRKSLPPLWCSPGGGCVTCSERRAAEALHRARAIGEAHARARMRMARFRLWLSEHQAPAALRYAAEHSRSPEAVAMAAEQVDVRWLGWACGLLGLIHYHLCSRGGTSPKARSILVTHPKWASLP